MSNDEDRPSSLVLDYLLLRLAIGIVGTALPFVLAIGALVLFRTGMQGSMSAYYHTGVGDVFVGSLCAIGVFFISYRGYPEDRVAGTLACVLGIGVALFPTAPAGDATGLQKTIGLIHWGIAAGFLLTLAYFSFFLFTKTTPGATPTPRKLARNRVYRACGITMVAALALILIHALLPDGAKGALAGLRPVFWLEAIAVVAFGVSWLTKGEAILRDET